MKKHLMIAAALLTATPTKARDAVSDDGNEVLELCDNGSSFMNGMCLGYVRGLYSSIQFSSAINKGSGLCTPSTATVGQMRDVYVQYVRNNPDQRHYDSTLLLIMAISQAWPCK